jgi:thiol-disulfide isomerase/thioredoxin
MKKIFKVICIFLITNGCRQSSLKTLESSNNLELTANKIEINIDSSFNMVISPMTDNNRLAAIYPKLKGIPDSLSNIKKYIFPLDDVQAIFQSYKAGLISKNECLNYLGKHASDTLIATDDYVKTFCVFVTGNSKRGSKYYSFDSNNNYDLSDETLYLLSDKILSNQPCKVLFEKFKNRKIVLDSTWIAIRGNNSYDAIWMKFCEQTTTSFTFNSVHYNLITSPTYGAKYSDKVTFEIRDSLKNTKQVFGYNEYALLGNSYYQVSCSSDGRTISLKADSLASKKGSTQLGMPALPFKTITLKGDSIQFPSDFKGKYVLLDFWSTGCPHCIEEIKNSYLDLYKIYGGDRFEIVGIADDPKSRVEKFVFQNNINWTMIPAQKSFLLDLYRVEAYPVLFLIDPNGVIILKGQDLGKGKVKSVLEKYLGPRS